MTKREIENNPNFSGIQKIKLRFFLKIESEVSQVNKGRVALCWPKSVETISFIICLRGPIFRNVCSVFKIRISSRNPKLEAKRFWKKPGFLGKCIYFWGCQNVL